MQKYFKIRKSYKIMIIISLSESKQVLLLSWLSDNPKYGFLSIIP